LRGDPSDNIPGVAGVGEKTACVLLREFGTIENLYKKIENLPASRQGMTSKQTKILTPRLIDRLKKNKEMAFFSKRLATIREDVPLKIDLKKLDWQKNFNIDKVKELFNRLDFQTLLKRLPGQKIEPKSESQQPNLF